MKKAILIILGVITIAIAIILVKISDNNIKKNNIYSFNIEFEEYKDKTIYGADILSIINKAIDNNEEHKVEKDENGYYKEDEDYSVKIDLTLLTKDKEGNKIENVYSMERLVEVRLRWIYKKFFTNTI